ncbi:hypothetical protein IR208_13500 [Heyndrickxia coagulans]|uniref:hypothetical protein n=1 Tax=Heyndrickxia coagulans TaxID=1398 RepID=UPI0015C67400|nr:hypothetical protein [Heyndrickxia coagulans]QPG52975.1 hypothetical protein IR208_13500 [Heyndrickxia coagulans]
MQKSNLVKSGDGKPFIRILLSIFVPSNILIKLTSNGFIRLIFHSLLCIAKASQSFAGKGRISFVEFKDAGNNVIAHYSQNNGWTMVMTKAEMARTSEFSAIYVEAWREAHYGKGNTIDGAAISSGSTLSVSV